jgi:septal ring factor EnvC (AmiA/AmiB activator)
MISLEEAEKQADKLKVEIETLTELLAQERARADALRALADARIKEKTYRTSVRRSPRCKI